MSCSVTSFVFFFNDTATTEIYTLSLHDALPIYTFFVTVRLGEVEKISQAQEKRLGLRLFFGSSSATSSTSDISKRSEEHTSELQSPCNLVCRLLLEKKKKIE